MNNKFALNNKHTLQILHLECAPVFMSQTRLSTVLIVSCSSRELLIERKKLELIRLAFISTISTPTTTTTTTTCWTLSLTEFLSSLLPPRDFCFCFCFHFYFYGVFISSSCKVGVSFSTFCPYRAPSLSFEPTGWKERQQVLMALPLCLILIGSAGKCKCQLLIIAAGQLNKSRVWR